jgi:anti-sigma-K factor RskA
MNDHDDIRGLIGAYALGAVAPDEQRAVEASVDADPTLRAELDRHLETAAGLAAGLLDGTEQPSEAVWERIATSIGAAAHTDSAARPRRSLRFVSAIATAAVAVSAVLAVQVFRQRAEIGGLRDDPLAAAVEEVREAGALEIALSGEVGADVVLAADGVGYLLGGDLPPLGTDRAYQLWAIVDDRVISAGVLGADPGISPFRVSGDVTGFALTVEIPGGVAVSEQQPVAVGLLGP